MGGISQGITVAELYRAAAQRLKWRAGHAGGDRLLTSETVQKPSLALVEGLNFAHPDCVQVLGRAEMEYLRRLDPEALRRAIEDLYTAGVAAVVVANGEEVPASMIEAADRTGTPLFTSPKQRPTLMRALSHILSQALAPSTQLHGVFLEVCGLGVLITADPMVGKSELALEPISCGHRLVADDAVDVFATSPDTLEGRCSTLLQDFMEVRGLGVISVRRLFGETAVKPRKHLKLNQPHPRGALGPGRPSGHVRRKPRDPGR